VVFAYIESTIEQPAATAAPTAEAAPSQDNGGVADIPKMPTFAFVDKPKAKVIMFELWEAGAILEGNGKGICQNQSKLVKILGEHKITGKAVDYFIDAYIDKSSVNMTSINQYKYNSKNK
jgi:hypothetical protein